MIGKKMVFIVIVEGGFLELMGCLRPCSTNSFWLGWTFILFCKGNRGSGKVCGFGHPCWNLHVLKGLEKYAWLPRQLGYYQHAAELSTKDWRLEHPSPEAYLSLHSSVLGFPRWLSTKESACNAGDPGLIPGSGRCSREENGNPLQYSFFFFPLQYSWLENPTDRGGWQTTIHGGAKNQTQLSN